MTAQEYFNDSDQGTTQLTRVCGPSTVRVPNVAGSTSAQAQSALHSAFLAAAPVSVTTTSCSASSNNLVVSTTPAIGQFIPIGSNVTLTVCNLNATVPNVVDDDDTTAENAIIAAGFIVGNVTMIPNCRLTFGGVLSQNPGPGPALRGTAVNLTESNGKQSNGKPCNIQ